MMSTTHDLRRLGLALLAGGALGWPAGATAGNRTVDSIHQAVVQRVDYVFDAATDGAGALAPGETARISGWFDAIDLGYGDRVSVDENAARGSATARNGVADLVGHRGLLVAEDAPVTNGAIPTGHIRVIVSRATASVPGCPDWQDNEEADVAGATHSNYGCATNSTMAAMVANPEDLVHGREGNDELHTAVSTRAIQTYQTKAPTGAGALKSESTGGK